MLHFLQSIELMFYFEVMLQIDKVRHIQCHSAKLEWPHGGHNWPLNYIFNEALLLVNKIRKVVQ